MLEDKLTQQQRIRLEAYAQVNVAFDTRTASTEARIEAAKKVAKFIETGEK